MDQCAAQTKMADLRKKRRLEILKKNKEKVDEENDKSEDYILTC